MMMKCPFSEKTRCRITVSESENLLDHIARCGVKYLLQKGMDIPCQKEFEEKIGRKSLENAKKSISKFKMLSRFLEYCSDRVLEGSWFNSRILERCFISNDFISEYDMIYTVARDLCIAGEEVDIQSTFGIAYLPTINSLHSILGFVTQEAGARVIYSIGCGRGVLEYALESSSEGYLSIIGVEVESRRNPLISNIVMMEKRKRVSFGDDNNCVVIFCCCAGGEDGEGGMEYIDDIVKNQSVKGMIIIDDSTRNRKGSCSPNQFEVFKRADVRSSFDCLEPIPVSACFCVPKNIWLWRRKLQKFGKYKT